MKMLLLSLTLSLALAAALPARAGIPGGGTSIEVRKNDVLLHVCAEDEDVVCVERDTTAFAHPFTGAECADAGLEPACVVSFVRGAGIRGRLELSADEDLASGDIASTATYRFRLGGERHLITESYPPGSRFGNWNPIATESQVFEFTGEGQFLDGELQTVADEVTRLLEDWLARRQQELPDGVLVLTRIERLPRHDSDHSDTGTDPLGSSATYLIEFEFARVQ
ncbi:MAG: hypothetical protein ABFS41_01285 [Myxococcota bacterium]